MPQKPMLLRRPTSMYPQPTECCPPVETTTSDSSCCPPPPQNALFPHPIPSEDVCPCVDAKPVKICGPVEITPAPAPPCSPVSIDYVKCDGSTGTATGTSCDLVQVVPHPDAVMKVQICNAKDVEKQILCDEITGHKVAVISDFTNSTIPVVSYWDLNTASAWTGNIDDLHECPDIDLESDPREVCVDGVTLTQWVVKSDGEPTGTVYYTDVNGQLVTVDSTAVITIGACQCCDQEIASAYADDLSGLVPATNILVMKPECCSVKIVTDVGSYIIPKKVQSHSSIDFKCPVTVLSVEITGDCSPSDILITTMKSIGC